jgi:hypothetical protein
MRQKIENERVYRGLSEWETEKGWLTDTCLDGQDTFKRLLAMFDL